MSDSELNNLKRDYDKFFNLVYNGRIGNNNKNDGSKYVGRGYNQLTGKANYQKYGNKVGIDIVSDPDKMLDDKTAAEVAVKFLISKGVPEFSNPKESTLYFADVNSGSPKRRARENSIEELQKFDGDSKSIPYLICQSIKGKDLIGLKNGLKIKMILLKLLAQKVMLKKFMILVMNQKKRE